ncbi:MAG: M67 family metallopeptidase [Gemmataceae bacterium]|nr:M67 family metallopeptidase [Gemmataceae bacterium]
MAIRLIVPASVHEALVAHARTELPNECCGLLAGKKGEAWRAEAYHPLVNSLASPVEYASEPRSMLAALRAIDAAGQELLAVCHSHPTSAPVPSRKDLDRNPFEDSVPHVILGLAGEPPHARAWVLGPDSFAEAEYGIG